MTAIELLKSAIEKQACVRKWMGHEDANTTLIYAHMTKRGESPMDFGRNLRAFQMPPQITFDN